MNITSLQHVLESFRSCFVYEILSLGIFYPSFSHTTVFSAIKNYNREQQLLLMNITPLGVVKLRLFYYHTLRKNSTAKVLLAILSYHKCRARSNIVLKVLLMGNFNTDVHISKSLLLCCFTTPKIDIKLKHNCTEGNTMQ